MLIKKIAVLFFPLIAVLHSTPTFAWGEVGHQTIGEIAERLLTPNARQAIVDILGPEKLAIAATWPDALRADSDFDLFKDYHYVEIATGKIYQNEETSKLPAHDAVTVMKNFPGILLDPNASRSLKIPALKYIIHIVGDIHQPLHVGNTFDNGANNCIVHWDEKTLMNLHEIWDGKLIDLDISQLRATHQLNRNHAFTSYTDILLAKYPMDTKQMADIQAADYFEWIAESQLERSNVYPDETPVTDESKRFYCQRIFDFTKAPLLTPDYKTKAIELTETRLVYAGVRLAGLLNKIFEKGSNSGTSESLTKQQIITKLNFSNY